MQLLEALERGKEEAAVDWRWDDQIAWVKAAYAKVLKDRGPFPGLGSVLEAIGFPGATVYVERCITNKGVAHARKHALERLSYRLEQQIKEEQARISALEKAATAWSRAQLLHRLSLDAERD